MNNEEKSKKIAMPCPACPCIWTKEKMYNQEYCKDCVAQDRFTGAMEMAQWKDEQLSKCLENLEKEYIRNSGKGLYDNNEIAAKLATLKRIEEEMSKIHNRN